MKKNDKEIMKQVLGAKSPFAFRLRDDKLVFYNNAVEAYRDVLMMLWAEFPRGFVDIPYFMAKYQGVGVRDAARLCGLRQYAMLKLWDTNDKDRLTLLRAIMGTLLKATGVAFDENAFINAVQAFDIFLQNSKIEERTESGSLVNFIKS